MFILMGSMVYVVVVGVFMIYFNVLVIMIMFICFYLLFFWFIVVFVGVELKIMLLFEVRNIVWVFFDGWKR